MEEAFIIVLQQMFFNINTSSIHITVTNKLNKTLGFVNRIRTSIAECVFIFPFANLKFERKNVKQSKIIKIEKNQNNLIRLLEHQSPEERQEFLNDIDYILCRFLKFKRKDLPWRNLGKQNEKWDKLIRKVRLIVSRIHLELIKKDRTLH